MRRASHGRSRDEKTQLKIVDMKKYIYETTRIDEIKPRLDTVKEAWVQFNECFWNES